MKHLKAFLCLAGAVAIALAVSAPVAESQLVCGAVITEDTTLTDHLVCTELEPGPPPSPAALTIEGEHITLDLGGHTISGLSRRGVIGVRATDTEGVTIKNGTITGFSRGVVGLGSTDLEVKDLLLRDQQAVGVGVYRPGTSWCLVRGSRRS